MSKENSFDIVSKVEFQEVNNAIHQAVKEIETRFDFKGSKSEILLNGEQITVISDDEYKLHSVIEILQSKFVKRGVSLKNLSYGKIEPASGGTVRQSIIIKNGIDQEMGKKITKLIRDSKLKAKAQIQGDQIRVSGKSKDDLQKVIQLLREENYPIELQFINFR
ncbi:YajQ family cyclic di-GMP-binding protein [Microaerobacter geothermalis]|uniref:YajQ family cyclic di-GMP-binding protein n=1 Tax=Microaerobacter geothermalis TaxID=674972 RepID=UPI001F197F04|nr:YajQ family cyclic di-GMP-binding protein [Microaerobacter geothermalis]MCF6093155.1 YajQ family cyclic di-GMP-binding protein [Microaerobacter geothermalis]